MPTAAELDSGLEPEELNTLDPWEHRSEHMRCKTCVWSVLKKPSKKVGRCRRHAPMMNGFPVIFTNDWCGDHRLDETKVGE